jgi:hypothetical protein
MLQRYTIPGQVAVHVDNALISWCQENCHQDNQFSDYLTSWVKAEAYSNVTSSQWHTELTFT